MKTTLCLSITLLASLPLLGQDKSTVSYYKDIVPIFKKSCTGCHHPGKMKGDLDLTTYANFKKGGKHGPSFVPGDVKKSVVVTEVTGEEPSMPAEGDPLTKKEIELIEKWIAQGAQDDTPADAGSTKLAAPPTYHAAPVISALAISPDGKLLAVSGYHEVILYSADGTKLVGRLVGESLRIDSVAFSPDGQFLAASGGAAAQFGEIQIWDVQKQQQLKSFRISNDTLYGVSFSQDSKLVAFGGGDKSVRVIQVADGKEVMKFDNHSDWVLGTTFTVDGKRLLSGSRDKAMKLISVANGQFIDDVNKLLEGVLCIARHPKEDLVLYGGELGTPRLYRISENQSRTFLNNDVNVIREFERQPGPIRAVAYAPDGQTVAIGSVGEEVRLYKTADGVRAATLKGHGGPIFGLVYHPTQPQIFTGGFDGKIRIFDTASGNLVKEFIPVPIQAKAAQQAAK